MLSYVGRSRYLHHIMIGRYYKSVPAAANYNNIVIEHKRKFKKKTINLIFSDTFTYKLATGNMVVKWVVMK